MCPSDGQGGWLIERFARRVTRCHLAMSSGSTNLLLKARNMDRSARMNFRSAIMSKGCESRQDL